MKNALSSAPQNRRVWMIGGLCLLAVAALLVAVLLVTAPWHDAAADTDVPRAYTLEKDGLTIRLLSESDAVADRTLTLTDRPLTSSRVSKIKSKLAADNILTLTDDRLLYLDDEASFTAASAGLTWTEAEAIRHAEDYLDDLGLLPSGDYLVKASGGGHTTLDLVQGTADSGVTDWWTVWFYQTYDNVPVVSTDDNGILLTMTENGLLSLQYQWKDIRADGQTESALLSEEEAVDAYFDQKGTTGLDEFTTLCYRRVYLGKEGKAVPAWVFGMNDAFTNAVYIDAATGEIIEIA